MTRLPSIQAEAHLRHLAQQFAHWRQRRTTPRGRIPQALWAQAVTLAQVLPCVRVAKHLGLTPQALKRRRDATRSAPVLTPPHIPRSLWKSRLPGVPPPRKWKSSGPTACACASRIVIPRPRWPRCSRPSWTPAEAPTHAPESHLCGRAPPSISGRGSIASRPCVGRRGGTIR
jgi:hypothetical protein